MIRIYSIIFCLIFISTNYGCSQDKTATTAEGQTVILKTDGTWHIDANTKLHENSAVTEDGELVLLGGDGKWFLTKVTVPPPSQQQNTYSSAVGTLAIPYSSATVSGTAVVYVPPSMKGNFAESKPLMLLLDPGGDAAGIVARWRHAADRFGWIIASTPVIKNGNDTENDMLHLLALLDAIGTNWPIDSRAMILGGMSGGGCGAYRHALERPDLFRGAIVECGHMGPFHDLQDRIRPGSIFFLATRDQDFNLPHMRTLAKALEGRGETVKLIELTGGHEPLRGDDADNALEWMSSQIR